VSFTPMLSSACLSSLLSSVFLLSLFSFFTAASPTDIYTLSLHDALPILFMRAVAHAACFFAKYPEYEAWGWEIHHSAKKDAPSGTQETCPGNPRFRL